MKQIKKISRMIILISILILIFSIYTNEKYLFKSILFTEEKQFFVTEELNKKISLEIIENFIDGIRQNDMERILNYISYDFPLWNSSEIFDIKLMTKEDLINILNKESYSDLKIEWRALGNYKEENLIASEINLFHNQKKYNLIFYIHKDNKKIYFIHQIKED